eukprot:gene5213-7251_t
MKMKRTKKVEESQELRDLIHQTNEKAESKTSILRAFLLEEQEIKFTTNEIRRVFGMKKKRKPIFDEIMQSFPTALGKAVSKREREELKDCQMIHGDFLKVKFKNWRDADVVFVNSTCYDDNVITELAKLAVGMKKGSYFVSLTKRLPTTDFKVLEHEMAKMSWGLGTIFIAQKTTKRRKKKKLIVD